MDSIHLNLLRIMSSSEKLCLQWNDFKESIASSFGNLREDKELTDVTLVCEDGQQLEAHKVILASSSPSFLWLLKKNTHPHPLIYMRGLKSEDLRAIVDFLYKGEANVFQENLDSFLSLAEELRLKGLTGTDTHQKQPEVKPSQTKNIPSEMQKLSPVFSKLNCEIDTSKISDFVGFDTAVAVQDCKIGVEVQNLDEQIKLMITKSDINSANGQGSMATCNICGKEAPLKAMPRHVEAYHIEGVTHACDICGKMSRSRDGLRRHKLKFHHKC